MNLDVFRDRRVLVTGHTGFKGSWLAIWLHRLGAKVVGYALKPPTDPSNFIVSGVSALVEGDVEGDVRDVDALVAVVADFAPDVVVHMAAQSLVRHGYDAPRETFETNVMGTLHLLEAVRLAGRPCAVVIVSSDKCYENDNQVWGYRENDRMGGFDPYSASKACAELVISSMRRSYFPPSHIAQHGIKVASARAGNVIGGGDWAPNRIVADVARSISANEPVAVRNPDAIRPWQHVLEPLRGYLMLAAAMLKTSEARLCDAWNFGPHPGTELPVRDLVGLIIGAWGKGTYVESRQPDAPHEAHVLRLSIDKAITELGWRPRWTVEEAARRAARWYAQYYAGGADMLASCRADIEAYEGVCPSRS